MAAAFVHLPGCMTTSQKGFRAVVLTLVATLVASIIRVHVSHGLPSKSLERVVQLV